MLVGITASKVPQGTMFWHAGRTYILATNEEQRRHPARGQDTVMAYHLADQGDRIPVTFNLGCQVFVSSK